MCFSNYISSYIREGESSEQRLGLEIEHFVVDDRGRQIGFDEISSLIYEVGRRLDAEILYMDGYPVGYYNGEYSTSLEPSCQFEISINPYSDIERIQDIYNEFRELWEPIFEERGYHFEVSDNLPIVESGEITPDEIPLSPKKRYKYMDRYFREVGKYGEYMMRASASTQISLDYSSETDMVRKLRILEKIAPILAIMLENKSNPDFTLPDDPDTPHLLRIQEWDNLDSERTGFIPTSFDKDFGYDKMSQVIYHTPLILFTDNGETTYVGSKCGADLVEEGVINDSEYDDSRRKKVVEHLMSMGFFHFRVKKYIEVRVADSVPIDAALGYVALLKGLIYSEVSLDRLEEALAAVDRLEDLTGALERIKRDGLNAVIYGDKTAREWADYLIEVAADSLTDTDKRYLQNVRTVWSYS